MIITLVTDQFYQNNHGTSVSAQRLYKGLVDRGHTVRVVAIDDGEHTPYALTERNFGKPINKIINSQGMQFAKPNKAVITSAIKDADIVHVYLPFKLGYKTINLCHELNVPCTAGFHLVPENITSTLHLNKFHPLNYAYWKGWYHTTYKHVQHIHCPSIMVADRLKKHGYKAQLHIISNGYNDNFALTEEAKPTILRDKFVIAVLGRFSREKRFDLLIKAVKRSKYADKIVLIFGGRGPLKEKIEKMAWCLPNYPIFLGAYNREQQRSLLGFADLYVHPADTEVEGMACLEAIACGCVPIVADSPHSATSQFTLHEHSIFRHGDHHDLTNKIDWWIEHPQELKEHRQAVAAHAKTFSMDNIINEYITMFEAAIQDWQNKNK